MAKRIWLLIWMYSLSTAAEGPRCPHWTSRDQCREDGSALDEYFYYVNGNKLKLTYDVRYLHLTCLNNVPLESEALPRFERAVEVPSVKLTACAPPPQGYAAALLALNVTVRTTLELHKTPARPDLLAAHLRDLDVDAFVLSSGTEPLRPEPAFVEPLVSLSKLQLTGVSLPPSAALLLPQTLRSLSLNEVGLASLPAEAFARLPALTRLVVRDGLLREVDLSESRALRSVILTAPVDGVTLGPFVENVTLRDVHSAALLGNCSSLVNVVVENAKEALPPGWLAACPAASAVRVWCKRRGAVGADEFRGARALRELEVRRCELRALPPTWLDAPVLERLDLSFNGLERLPNELVGAAPALAVVEMASNRLNRAAVATLAALPALRYLSLERNPLSDLCGSNDVYVPNALSPLWKSRGLRTLKLAHTGLTRICRDWRTELVQLTALDLRANNVSLLGFDDLQWRRENATEVDLRRNPVRDVRYSYKEFAAVLAGNVSNDFVSSRMTTLVLDAKLKCDCAAYWYARAIRERPDHARAQLDRASCDDDRALDVVPPHELLCALPPELGRCPAGCVCRMSGERSELSCAGAGLRRVPRAPPALPARALRLPRNNITRIALDDITPDLEVLDLSDNLITSVDAATTAALFGARRSVRLAGNPLRCDCDALPLLRALAAHAARSPAAPRAACAGARESAHDAAERLARRCAPAVWPFALAALALAAASAVAAGCLTRPVARQRLKRFLFERGLCLRWLLRPLREEDDDERPFDAFVSFSHLDAQFAAELALRLERGAALRLCLHDRDWTPGEWIPAQIAQSVRRSRRTLVLLSERFLTSSWARAELREAYGAALREQRPRLLLLLLPGLTPERAAAADSDLRAYLASVTYLRWEDPHFWDKLLMAMPRPRPRPAPSPPPPPAASTPAPPPPA